MTVCCFYRVFKKTSGNGSVSFHLYRFQLTLLDICSTCTCSQHIFKTQAHDNHLSHYLLQICLYLGKRDFVDHVDKVDSVGKFYFTLKNVLFLKIVMFSLFYLNVYMYIYIHHFSIHVQYFKQPVISFSDGVLKIDPSDLNGRKGMI